MTAAETLAVSIWFAGMAYFGLCVGIPEIRMYWKGSDTKMGLVSCLGCAMFFWGPALVFMCVATGLTSEVYKFAGYIFCGLGLLVAGIGYLIDIST